MTIELSLSRGPLDGRRNVLLLPPPGERVAPDGNCEPVRAWIYNGESQPGEIVDLQVTPAGLSVYVNFTGLRNASLPPGQSVELTQVTLHNPADQPLAGPTHGQLELTVRFGGQDRGVLRRFQFELQPFPVWQGIFAVDFGNSASTFVVLPPGTVNLFGDKTFRCLNFSDPEGPEDPEPTAVRFDAFAGDQVIGWDVGKEVLRKFQALISEGTVGALQRSDGFMTGGVKRYLGVPADQPIRPVSSIDGQTSGPSLTGNQLNGYVLKRFLRKAEECQRPGQTGPVGRLTRVLATHPVNYTPLQKEVMREIYQQFLGIEQVDLRYDEATAAAIYYLAKQLHGRGRIHEFWARTDRPQLPLPAAGQPEKHTFNMLVFDCGGGTTDIALLRVEIERPEMRNRAGFATSNWFEVRPRVYGLTGLRDFAGDNMTLEAMKLLRFRLAEKLVTLGQELDVDDKTWSPTDKGNFRTSLTQLGNLLATCKDTPAPVSFYQKYAEAINEQGKRIVPTDFASKLRHRAGEEYLLRLNLFHQLWKLAEDLKLGLSRNETFELNLPPDAVVAQYRKLDGSSLAAEIQSLTFTREELNQLLSGEVGRAWRLAADLCEDLAEGEQVHQVVLAGNGSRYPLVKRLLREVLAEREKSRFEYQEQYVLLSVDDAKLACAKGAAVAEWYRTLKPSEHTEPDETIVSFHGDTGSKLPFSFLLQTSQDFEKLFHRGDEIPPQQEYLEKSRAVQDLFPIFQGLMKEDFNERVGYCQFRTPANPPRPDWAPPDASPRICFRIDRQHDLRAFLVWEHENNRTETELPREPLPESPDAKYKNPFMGWN